MKGSERVRVLHVIPNLQKGGAERLVVDILREFKKYDNFEVRLLVLKNSVEYDVLDLKESIVHISSSVRFDILRLKLTSDFKYLEYVNLFKPHVIHSHIYLADVLVKSYYQFDAVYFTHVHGKTNQYSLFDVKRISKKIFWTNFAEKVILKRIFRKCNNTFLVVSSYYKGALMRELGLKEESVIMLPNAIDIRKFISNVRSKDLRVVTTKIRLISIGRLTLIKGHEFLIECMHELSKKSKFSFELTILGEGEERNNLQNLIKRRGLETLIKLLGNVDNPEVYLHTSDIYVHGAYEEAFGLVLVEAMASGLPVVTTDAKGNRDIIVDQVNGYLILERDVTLFCNAIEKLIDSRKKYREISQNNIIKALGDYNIDKYVSKLADIYISRLH